MDLRVPVHRRRGGLSLAGRCSCVRGTLYAPRFRALPWAFFFFLVARGDGNAVSPQVLLFGFRPSGTMFVHAWVIDICRRLHVGADLDISCLGEQEGGVSRMS